MTLSIFDELADDFRDFVKEATIEIAIELASQMPVDTAEARSNVIVSVGADTNNVISPYFPFEKGSGPNKNETVNLAKTIEAIRTEANKLKPWQNTYIVNNTYQAAAIDEGSVRSRQSAPNMTDRAIYIGLRKAEIKMSRVFRIRQYD